MGVGLEGAPVVRGGDLPELTCCQPGVGEQQLAGFSGCSLVPHHGGTACADAPLSRPACRLPFPPWGGGRSSVLTDLRAPSVRSPSEARAGPEGCTLKRRGPCRGDGHVPVTVRSSCEAGLPASVWGCARRGLILGLGGVWDAGDEARQPARSLAAQMGVGEGKSIGQWYGPNTVAQVLKYVPGVLRLTRSLLLKGMRGLLLSQGPLQDP